MSNPRAQEDQQVSSQQQTNARGQMDHVLQLSRAEGPLAYLLTMVLLMIIIVSVLVVWLSWNWLMWAFNAAFNTLLVSSVAVVVAIVVYCVSQTYGISPVSLNVACNLHAKLWLFLACIFLIVVWSIVVTFDPAPSAAGANGLAKVARNDSQSIAGTEVFQHWHNAGFGYLQKLDESRQYCAASVVECKQTVQRLELEIEDTKNKLFCVFKWFSMLGTETKQQIKAKIKQRKLLVNEQRKHKVKSLDIYEQQCDVHVILGKGEKCYDADVFDSVDQDFGRYREKIKVMLPHCTK